MEKGIIELVDIARSMSKEALSLMYGYGRAHFSTFLDPRDLFGNLYIAERITRYSSVVSLKQGLEGRIADAYIGGDCACQAIDLNPLKREVSEEMLSRGRVFYNILFSGNCPSCGWRWYGKELDIKDEDSALRFFRQPMEEKVVAFRALAKRLDLFDKKYLGRLHIIPSIIKIYDSGEPVHENDKRDWGDLTPKI